MAISRPFLLALLGAVLLGVTFFAVQNARDNASTDDAAPAAESLPDPQASSSAEQAPPAPEPAELVQAAFESEIDSTAFSADLAVRSGKERARFDVSGQVQSGAANDVPEVAIDALVVADGERFQGGFTTVGDKAFFTQGENGWRVPDQVWSPVVDAVASGGARPQEQLPGGPDSASWVKNPKLDGTETLDGVETQHVTASIDPKAILADIATLARPGGVETPRARDLTAAAVKRAELGLWVGSDDKLVRRMTMDVVLAPRGEDRTEMSMRLDLTGVNEPQEIRPPAAVRSGMPEGDLGEFVEGFVTGLTGRGGGDPVSLEALTSPNPRRAARAVDAGKKVVILFENPRGLDDRAMSRVMRELDRRTQALVLTDHVDAVDRYGKMVEDLGVSQTPSVVIIDRAGSARLLEGYVDSDTLAQAVADAR